MIYCMPSVFVKKNVCSVLSGNLALQNKMLANIFHIFFLSGSLFVIFELAIFPHLFTSIKYWMVHHHTVYSKFIIQYVQYVFNSKYKLFCYMEERKSGLAQHEVEQTMREFSFLCELFHKVCMISCWKWDFHTSCQSYCSCIKYENNTPTAIQQKPAH